MSLPVIRRGAAVAGEVIPRPLDQNQQPALERHDVEQMDEEPDDPGEKAVQAQTSEIGDGGGPADRRQAPLS